MWRGVHRLGIKSLLFIPDCHFIASASFDSTFVVIDSLDGTVVFRSEDAGNTCVTGLAWDSIGSNLLLLDSRGDVTVWSSYKKSIVSCKHLITPVNPIDVARCPASRIAAKAYPAAAELLWLHGGTSTIVCCSQQRGILYQFDIAREVETVQLKGHSDLVVGISAIAIPSKARSDHHRSASSLSPEEEEEEKEAASEISNAHAETLVISAGADSSLRFWDSYSTLERYSFNEQSKTSNQGELSCLLSLSMAVSKLASGNQDGSVSWWDVDTGFINRSAEHSNAVTDMCEATVTNVRALSKEQYFISSSEDGCILLWLLHSAATGKFSPHVIYRIKVVSWILPFS